VSGIDYNTWLFADSLYFTPAAHRLFGNHAYAKLGERW
jgi:phospholipase/lecithinase/hemolysin